MKTEADTIVFESPLGSIRATASQSGISEITFTDRPDKAAATGSENPHLKKLRAELDRYFDGKLRKFTTRVDPAGTPFRMRVWEELGGIPYGGTISYIELARRIGNAKASRAVGGANGANPVCIVIPCHRVIAADGTLGGYSAGLWRKEKLLALERGGSL
ncbi:MAG: methylated-DNA--[protein]-cysteine S-methyltransferase [Chthoniobacteraceae bacterium]